MNMTRRSLLRLAALVLALPLTGCSYNKFVGQEEAIKEVADARARLLAAKSPEESIAAANQQTSALGRLLAIAENYPQLRANEQFNRLMDELSGTENRIAQERRRYNEAVQAYNTARRQFPANITAKIFGFKEYKLFEAPASARAVPQVK